MKPQPPEYPRNVPDMDFDEDMLLPGAVVYTQDEDDAGDAEELAKIRAAKRSRIEANAQAYLRGEGLFILSAGLRGPFDDGWRNPWAPKSKKRKHETVAEDTAVSRAQKILRRDRTGSQTPWKSNHQKQPTPQTSTSIFERARSEHLDQTSPEQKVENWLRRNSALPQQTSFVEPTSPTPKKQPPRPRSSRQDWTPTKQVITVSSQDVHAPIQHPDLRVAESFETIVPNHGKNVYPVNAHSRLQNALEAASPKTTRKRQPSSERAPEQEVDDSSRAEAAIIRMKRRHVDPGNMTADHLQVAKHATKMLTSVRLEAAQPAPKTETSVYHDQQPQPSPAASEVKLKELETSIDDQLRQEEYPQPHYEQAVPTEEKASTRSMLPPPSTAASEMQSTNVMPSAQPRSELQTSTSNVSSGALLSKAPDIITNPPAELFDDSIHHTVPTSLEHANKPDVTASDVIDKVSSMIEAEAQSVPAASHPENREPPHVPSPRRESSSRNLEKTKALSKSPAPSKKTKANNKRKSASFTVDSSALPANGSIKNVLKIQKANQTAKSSFQKASPPPFYNEPDIGMDTSVEQLDNSPPRPEVHLHSPQANKTQPAKSILKSTNTLSSAVAATLSSKCAGKLPEQVGSSHSLLISGQNGVAHEDDEAFDLDGAINDMGSFLSTWEEEKVGVRAT